MISISKYAFDFLFYVRIVSTTICLVLENQNYKDYKKVYSYKILLGDSYDSEKYAITPTKLCRTSFTMFEDKGYKDHHDDVPSDDENNSSSDKANKIKVTTMSIDFPTHIVGRDGKQSPRKKKRQKYHHVNCRTLLIT